MPTGENTFRSLPPQDEQTDNASSVKLCTTSSRSAQSVQAYW
jgi:hypothetical protein